MPAYLFAGAGAPEWKVLPLVAGACLIALGLAALIAGLSGSERFFESQPVQIVVTLFGVGGARVFFMLLGAAGVIGGFLVATTGPRPIIPG